MTAFDTISTSMNGALTKKAFAVSVALVIAMAMGSSSTKEAMPRTPHHFTEAGVCKDDRVSGQGLRTCPFPGYLVITRNPSNQSGIQKSLKNCVTMKH